MRTVGIMIVVRPVVVRITAVMTSRELMKRSEANVMKRFSLYKVLRLMIYLFRFLRASNSESESVLALETVSGSDK